MPAERDARERLRQLLADHSLTQAGAAALICEQTMRPCSVRAVRAWLNDPAGPSVRTCPEWALTVLETALASRAAG